MQVVGERDGAVEGEAGPRADGEVPGRGGVAHEHDVPVVPGLADDARELHPHGCAAQVVGVGNEGLAAQWAAKMRSQAATISSLVIVAKPKASQVSGRHSTMNVAVSASNW
jgi:hypothetical protein